MAPIPLFHKDIKEFLSEKFPTTADNKYNTFRRYIESLLQFQKEYNFAIINKISSSLEDDADLYMVFKSRNQCELLYKLFIKYYAFLCDPVNEIQSCMTLSSSDRYIRIQKKIQVCNNEENRDAYIDQMFIKFNKLVILSILLQNIKSIVHFIIKHIYYVSFHRTIIDFVRELATIKPKMFMDLHFDTNHFEFEAIIQLSKLCANIGDVSYLTDIMSQFYCMNYCINDDSEQRMPNKYTHFIIHYDTYPGFAEDYYKEIECYIDASDIDSSDIDASDIDSSDTLIAITNRP